jgi:hypothetical protein
VIADAGRRQQGVRDDYYDRDKTTTAHQRPVRQERRTCAAPSLEQPGSVAHRDKLAAWQLLSKMNLVTFLSLLS